ncbi:MAG: hypothetical protein M5R36_21180 [Deltaproteobacteria bacterium]|nr:hypothetical protein [Deltaproteobacteria bacterium]
MSPEFYADLQSSPGVFLTEFDGMQPITGDYSALLNRAQVWSENYRKELAGACRIYTPRNAITSANDTAILYNFIVNELVDVWGAVLVRSGNLNTAGASPGTRRQMAEPNSLTTPMYRPTADLDYVGPLAAFTGSRAPAGSACSSAGGDRLVTPTTTVPPPTTTTTTEHKHSAAHNNDDNESAADDNDDGWRRGPLRRRRCDP